MTVASLNQEFSDWLVQLRREFHRFPEPAYKEFKTAETICRELKRLDVPFEKGVGGTGIVARLQAVNSGLLIAYRADMDALYLEEANDVAYRSQNTGYMHACGHDGHMTIALGILRRLKDTGWHANGAGEILFIFQPAEEGGAGARAMLDSGFFDDKPVKAVFAGHLYPELPVGQFGIAENICNAAADLFTIRLTGKGGHGAHPHQCKDPIIAGAHLVVQFQNLISREIDPLASAVVTIGQFHAGTAANIIPETAVLNGTLRTLQPDMRERLIARIRDMVTGTAKSFDVEGSFEIKDGYPALINDPKLVAHAIKTTTEVFGGDATRIERPRMGSEDFSFFCQQWGGFMIGIGCHNPHEGFQYGLHSSHFNFDENALVAAVLLFENLLKRYLDGGNGKSLAE